ncbi:MAG: acyl-CoA reductase, partial [Bacteroidetes bacterium HGW-Bacteroidetes-12]
MNLTQRIDSFEQLGVFIKQFTENQKNDTLLELNNFFYTDFSVLIEQQKSLNGWFTKENVLLALHGISLWLTAEALQNWVSKYSFLEKKPKNVGVIMAGNIPLVGFHDMLSVLMSGNNFVGKCASNDATLIQKIVEILVYINPNFKQKIKLVEKIQNTDNVSVYIATGS